MRDVSQLLEFIRNFLFFHPYGEESLAARVKAYYKDAVSSPDKFLDWALNLTDAPDWGPATFLSRIPYVFWAAFAIALPGPVGMFVASLMLIAAGYCDFINFKKQDLAKTEKLRAGSIRERYKHVLEKIEDTFTTLDTKMYLDNFDECARLNKKLTKLQNQETEFTRLQQQAANLDRREAKIFHNKIAAIRRQIKNTEKQVAYVTKILDTEEERLRAKERTQPLSSLERYILKFAENRTTNNTLGIRELYEKVRDKNEHSTAYLDKKVYLDNFDKLDRLINQYEKLSENSRDAHSIETKINRIKAKLNIEEKRLQAKLDGKQAASLEEFIVKVDFVTHQIIRINNPRYQPRLANSVNAQSDIEAGNRERQPLLGDADSKKSKSEIVKESVQKNFGRGLGLAAYSAMLNWELWWSGVLTFGPTAAGGFIGTSIVLGLSLGIPFGILVWMVQASIKEYLRSPIEKQQEKIQLNYEAAEYNFLKKTMLRLEFELTEVAKRNALPTRLQSYAQSLNGFGRDRKTLSPPPMIESYLIRNGWEITKLAAEIFDNSLRKFYVLMQFVIAVPTSMVTWYAMHTDNKELSDNANGAPGIYAAAAISLGMGVIALGLKISEKIRLNNAVDSKIDALFNQPIDEQGNTLGDQINAMLRENHASLASVKTLTDEINNQGKNPEDILRKFSVAKDPSAFMHHLQRYQFTMLDPGNEAINAFGSYVYIVRSILTVILLTGTFTPWNLVYAIPAGIAGMFIRQMKLSSQDFENTRDELLEYASELLTLLQENKKTLDAYIAYLEEQKVMLRDEQSPEQSSSDEAATDNLGDIGVLNHAGSSSISHTNISMSL